MAHNSIRWERERQREAFPFFKATIQQKKSWKADLLREPGREMHMQWASKDSSTHSMSCSICCSVVMDPNASDFDAEKFFAALATQK